MADLAEFERDIETKLRANTERDRREREALIEHRRELEQRHELFVCAARTLTDDVIRPRIEKLSKFFPNSKVADREPTLPNRCRCEFRHTARFPASVNLVLGVYHDDEIRNLVLYGDIEILPIFFKFTPHDETIHPLEKLDQAKCAEWYERRISEFIDTYLGLEHSDQYQQQTLVTDPVCGARIRKAMAGATHEFHGVAYYFCTPACEKIFTEAPDQYVVHVKS